MVFAHSMVQIEDFYLCIMLLNVSPGSKYNGILARWWEVVAKMFVFGDILTAAGRQRKLGFWAVIFRCRTMLVL